MRTRTTIICFQLLLVATVLYLSGCGGGGGNAASYQGPDTVVTITNYSGSRIANVEVVLGDSNGAMVASGKTDENGQITFTNSPINSTVTAALSCLRTDATTTTYSMNVQYDVNGSVVMTMDNCEMPLIGLPPPVGNSVDAGTITLNLTGMPGNVVSDEIIIGRRLIFGMSLITSQTLTVQQSDLNADGTISILAVGWDVHNDYVAYGLLQNQAFASGMTVNLPMTAMSYLQFHVTNLPASTVTLRTGVSGYSDGGFPIAAPEREIELSSAPSSTTIAVPYIPGLGTRATYGLVLYLDRDGDGILDGTQMISRSTFTAPADQTFDISTALSVPVVSVTSGDTARPTISWSGADPAASSIDVSARMESSSGMLYLSINNFRRSRTGLTFPELPDSLADFRPTQLDYASVSSYSFGGNGYSTSYGYYSRL